MNGPSQTETAAAASVASAAPKVTKLRESCDSCLVAKVKCSKTRPVCVRCLANGAVCGYSPSSRAGRKTRISQVSKTSTRREKASELMEVPPPTPSSFLPLMHSMLDTPDRPMLQSNNVFHNSSSVVSAEGSNRRHSLMDNIVPTPREGLETPDFFPTPPFGEDFGDILQQFSPQAFLQDFSTPTPSPRNSTCQPSVHPSWTAHENSYPTLPSFQIPFDLMPFGQPTSLSTPSPEVSAAQDNAQASEQTKGETKHTCDCFALCLQALQTLHNHSRLPASAQPGGLPFDVVLTINREAMLGCAAMLDCATCVSKSGSGISTMLLATIFGKIISLYGSACFFRFGPSKSNQSAVKLAFGAYTLTGEDRRLLEMEIILLELRKVENILSSYQEIFRNAQAEKDETSVYSALTAYLDKNLRYILDFLQVRKGGTCT